MIYKDFVEASKNISSYQLEYMEKIEEYLLQFNDPDVDIDNLMEEVRGTLVDYSIMQYMQMEDSDLKYNMIEGNRQNSSRKYLLNRYPEDNLSMSQIYRKAEDKDYKYAEIFTSDEMKINLDVEVPENNWINRFFSIIDRAKSNDIITRDYKEIDYLPVEVVIQKTIDISNRFAHAYDKRIYDLYLQTTINDENIFLVNQPSNLSRSQRQYAIRTEFERRLISAYHDIENSDLQIDFNDIQDFLNKNKNNNDIDFSQNSNIMKVIDISKKYFKNQKYTSDFLANYCEMLQLEGKSQNWFYAKNTLQNIEMKYQDRATKELKELGESEALEKTTYTFICEDNTLLPDGRESYRIVTMDKKFYDEYIKFNNTCYLSDAYVKYALSKVGVEQKDMTEEAINEARNQLRDIAKKIGVNVIDVRDSYKFQALVECGSVTVSHRSKEDVDKFCKDNNITELCMNPSILPQCLARSGQEVNSNSIVAKENNFIMEYQKKNKKICENNEKKFHGDIDSFNKEYDLLGCFIKERNGVVR